MSFPGGSVENNLPAVQEMQEMWVQFLDRERPLGAGSGNWLWYSCLEKPMDRGTWLATVLGVEKNWTRLSTSLTMAPTLYLEVKCSHVSAYRKFNPSQKLNNQGPQKSIPLIYLLSTTKFNLDVTLKGYVSI